MSNLSVMFKGVNAIEFARRFPNNEACLRFLEEKKWKNGYQCVHCGWNRYVKGRTSFHRRCQRCAYDESVTANTLFHDMRLPMMKAFYLLFRIATKKKGLSTVELAGEVGIRQTTAWLFKRKIQVAMRVIDMEKLSLDEFIIGPKTALSGSTSATELTECEHVLKSETDQKRAGRPKKVQMIDPDKNSLKALGFKGRGVYALLFKIWLRGIHHKCSRALFFAYCDEFWFRQGHRSQRERIFENSLKNVLQSTPHPYAVLTCSSA
jgi:hypothetical protein